MLSSSFSKYTVYFTYVISLNYWDANLLFICLFVLSLYLMKVKLFFTISLVCLCKELTFYSTIFYKTLIINLMVGTVVLHPLLFYISLVFFLLKNYSKGCLYFVNYQYISLLVVSVCLMCTLFLGSIWAIQSTSWGYFWVGDIVEWILLFKIMYILFCLHLWKNVNLCYNWFIFSLSLLSTLILIRLNLLSTRHNFISVSITSYVLVFFYILFVEIFCKIFNSLKKYNNYNLVILIITLLVLTLSFLRFFFIIKYIFVCCVSFFFYKTVVNSVRGLYYHAILLSFWLVWAILFNFFYLSYVPSYNIFYEYTQIFENSKQTFYAAIVQITKFYVLEIIVFKNLEIILSCFYIVHNLVVSVVLNNFHLFPVFIVGIFIFKNGWI